MRSLFAATLAFALSLSASAAVTLVEPATGWFESGYVTWAPVEGASTYNVYIAPADQSAWTPLDPELVRQYPGYLRADAVGLRAGDYRFRIVPVVGGVEQTAEALTTDPFTATSHDRSGFAHVGMDEGIGAYQNDGTLKAGAKVIYVWADNAKTVSTDVITSSKGGTTRATGLQDIIYYYQKGYDTTPLSIRIIGTIKAADMDSFGSSAEGLQVKGKNDYAPMPITLEGIGDDAALHGFGILCRACHGTEFRNFAIMYCMDDCLSLDTGNSNVWIHNMDFFYGQPGSDSDQAKGDGTVDVKDDSHDITVSYCHFYDSGKSSLGGMKSEHTTSWLTYHHNWFDHSDSRHPRIRTMFFHIYNNYFDGNSKYGVGVTMGGSAFVEQNYFRNCKYPMLISCQGTDAEGSGTFSGEAGGVIKAFGNEVVNPRKLQYYDGQQTDGRWDAVLVGNRAAEVTATAYSGGTSYNAEADLAARTTYLELKFDAAADVPTIVRGWLGAGRMNHGDFTWTFLNAAQDENYAVIQSLTQAVQQYQSTLVGFADGTPISNGGATERVDGGDGKGVDPVQNDAYVPSWAGGGGGTVSPDDQQCVIGTDADYFWFNEANADQVNAYLADGTITLSEGSAFRPTATVESGGTALSDYVGSLQLAKESGYATFYCVSGITRIDFYLARTGSMKGAVQASNDGSTFTDLESYTGSKGTKELSVTLASPSPYIRLTNTATGSLHVQGLRLYRPADDIVDPGDDEALHTLPADTDLSSVIYDLQGRRLTRPTAPGIYVVGGRRILFN